MKKGRPRLSAEERARRVAKRSEVGGWLSRWRKAAGLSQAQLAAVEGVTKQAVSAWERGRVSVPERVLAMFCG